MVVIERTNVRHLDIIAGARRSGDDRRFVHRPRSRVACCPELLSDRRPDRRSCQAPVRGRPHRGGARWRRARSSAHRRVLEDLFATAADSALSVARLTASPLRGPAGNIEFLALLNPGGKSIPMNEAIDAALAGAPQHERQQRAVPVRGSAGRAPWAQERRGGGRACRRSASTRRGRSERGSRRSCMPGTRPVATLRKGCAASLRQMAALSPAAFHPIRPTRCGRHSGQISTSSIFRRTGPDRRETGDRAPGRGWSGWPPERRNIGRARSPLKHRSWPRKWAPGRWKPGTSASRGCIG